MLLPSKESFTPNNAGAIAGVVHDLACASATPEIFHIYGTDVENAFSDVNFTGIAAHQSLFNGQNIGFANAYLDHIRKHINNEFFQRFCLVEENFLCRGVFRGSCYIRYLFL